MENFYFKKATAILNFLNYLLLFLTFSAGLAWSTVEGITNNGLGISLLVLALLFSIALASFKTCSFYCKRNTINYDFWIQIIKYISFFLLLILFILGLTLIRMEVA